MASKRPFTTYYSNGSEGHSSTIVRAAIRAFKHVVEGQSRRAQVFSPHGDCLVEVEKLYNKVTTIVKVPRK